MAKAISKTANKTAKKAAPKRDWMEEEDKAQPHDAGHGWTEVDNSNEDQQTLAPTHPGTDRIVKAKAKAKGEGRQPNHNSFRWVAIDIIAKNPGLPTEELIKLMDMVKPGKDAAYWKRRIARAYHLTNKFAQQSKPSTWAVKLPPKPATQAVEAVEEV